MVGSPDRRRKRRPQIHGHQHMIHRNVSAVNATEDRFVSLSKAKTMNQRTRIATVRSRTCVAVAMLLTVVVARPAFAEARDLHAKFSPCESCRCQTSEVLSLRLAPGPMVVKLRIEGWSPTNHTGYPAWMNYNGLGRNLVNWTGWSESLEGASDRRIQWLRGRMTPEKPKHGDVVLFEGEYRVHEPIEIQTQISSERWYDGSGACNQHASEHWFSISANLAGTSPGQATAGKTTTSDATLAGKWAWVSGQELLVHGNGSCEVFKDGARINECNWTRLADGQFRLTHRNGGWIDTVRLSADRSAIDGVNNTGHALHGTRMAAAPSSSGQAAIRAVPLSGRWTWVAGQTLVIATDGSFEVFLGQEKINVGQWVSLDGARYRLTHRNGGWVDTITLSADGRSIDGVNNRGGALHGTRQ